MAYPTRHQNVHSQRKVDLYAEAKRLADLMWEEANRLADIMAPEVPVNAEVLQPLDQLILLETVAAELPPHYWNNPDAVEALFKLKRELRGVTLPYLRDIAAQQRRMRRNLPDPRISPANPRFQEVAQRLGVAS